MCTTIASATCPLKVKPSDVPTESTQHREVTVETLVGASGNLATKTTQTKLAGHYVPCDWLGTLGGQNFAVLFHYVRKFSWNWKSQNYSRLLHQTMTHEIIANIIDLEHSTLCLVSHKSYNCGCACRWVLHRSWVLNYINPHQSFSKHAIMFPV